MEVLARKAAMRSAESRYVMISAGFPETQVWFCLWFGSIVLALEHDDQHLTPKKRGPAPFLHKSAAMMMLHASSVVALACIMHAELWGTSLLSQH